MQIDIQHNAADTGFFTQSPVSDSEYREYVVAFAEACVAAVRAAYPAAEIASLVDWRAVHDTSLYITASDDSVGDHVREIVQRVWDQQQFVHHA